MAAASGLILTGANFGAVYKATAKLKPKWRSLGIALELDVYYLDEIESKYKSDLDRCLEAVVREWLKAKPSLQTLLTALRGDLLHDEGIAEDIASNTWIFKTPEEREAILTQLYSAARNGDTRTIKRLARCGVDLNHTEEEGYTALLFASQNGHLAVVSVLLDAGSNIHVANKNGFTPLHKACQGGHTEVVKVLHNHGADTHALTKLDPCLTPLQLACLNGHGDIVDILIDDGVDLDQLSGNGMETALHKACWGGYTEIVLNLIWAGATVDRNTEFGFNPLHVACQEGKAQIVKALLDNGANIHALTKMGNGTSPLQLACLAGQADVVDVLINHQADLNQLSRNGLKTALIYACENRHVQIVRQLLNRGAKVSTMNKEGMTALHLTLHADIKAVLHSYMQ